MIGIADIDLIVRNSRGEENGVASKRSAAGAASHWLAVSANLSGKQARTKIPRKGMRPARLGVGGAMATYNYGTPGPSKPIRTFEVKQSVHDDPLRSDPKTGEGARRVISAGYNVLVRGKSVGPSVGSVGSH